jgi:hypothetical protein
VDRRAGQLDAVVEGGLMHAQTVQAFAAKRRDERGMDVDDPVFKRLHDGRAQNDEEARQDDKLDVQAHKLFVDCLVEALAARKVLIVDHEGRNSGAFRAFERVGVRLGGDDGGEAAVFDPPEIVRVDDRLKVRPVAGDQNGCSYHLSSTPFSPLTQLPITYGCSPI